MLQALLHGKLSRDHENLEDVLTSNVFGVLRYTHPEAILLPFLGSARSLAGSPIPASALSNSAKTELDFWPKLRWAGGVCEPDVLLRLETVASERWLIGIEVKYRSGKSSFGDLNDIQIGDQLAKEWDAVQRLAEKESRTPILVYLTADFGMPRGDLEASSSDYRKINGRAEDFECFWLSWHYLPAIVKRNRVGLMDEDLLALAHRLGLGYFEGFSTVRPGHAADWRFRSKARSTFDFSVNLKHQVIWRFENNAEQR